MRHKKRRRGKWKKALGQTKQLRYKGRERARRNQSDTVTEPKLIKVGSQVPNNRASILAATQSDFSSPFPEVRWGVKKECRQDVKAAVNRHS